MAAKDKQMGYSSPKWAIGITMCFFGTFFHVLVLPYADITLLSCNSATAIVANMLLSIYILKEKFIAGYDLIALFLITAGCFSIVLTVNTEQVSYEPADIIRILVSTPTLIYLFCCVILITANKIILDLFLKKMRTFEKSCQNWDFQVQTQRRDEAGKTTHLRKISELQQHYGKILHQSTNS